jgi:uncharacterized membrane protein YvbJ
MRCAKCGAENPEGKILCRVCGARLRPAATQAVGGRQAGPVVESDEELRVRVTYDLTRILWVTGVVIAVGVGLGLLLK